MSTKFDPDEVEYAGDKIIVGSCPYCKSKGFDHEFYFQVSRLTSQKDFLRYARCQNCGHKGLVFVEEYDI